MRLGCRSRGRQRDAFASPFRDEYGRLGGIPLGQEGRHQSALLLFRPEAPSSVFTAVFDQRIHCVMALLSARDGPGRDLL